MVMAINDLAHDSSLVSAAAHLAQESSMLVMQHPGIRDAGGLNQHASGSADDVAAQINEWKSVYRMLFVDADSDVKRVEANFAGVPDLIDRYAARLAAIFGIPRTRFHGEPPQGFQATGESDFRNYLLMVDGIKSSMLSGVGERFDVALSRHAGLREMPAYEWPPIVDPDPIKSAEISKIRADTMSVLLMARIIDENEARERLAGDPLLDGLGPMPEPDMARNAPEVVVPARPELVAETA